MATIEYVPLLPCTQKHSWKLREKKGKNKLATETTSFKVGSVVARVGHKLPHTVNSIRVTALGVIEYEVPGTSAGKNWFVASELKSAAAPKAAAPARFSVRASGPHQGESYVVDNQPSSTGKTFRMSSANAEKAAKYLNSL